MSGIRLAALGGVLLLAGLAGAGASADTEMYAAAQCSPASELISGVPCGATPAVRFPESVVQA